MNNQSKSMLFMNVLLILGGTATTLPAGTICPSVGVATPGTGVNAGTGCFVLFTYSNLPTGGLTINRTIDPTVLRYDSFDGDDITVGVVNNVQSGTAPFLVTRLDLTSTNPFGDFSGPNIFGFDSDGICDVSPKISVGCPFSGVGPAGSISNGYSGPGVTFTALTLNSGTVFFNGGGIGQGRTGYFGLEDVPRGGGDTPEPATSLLIGSGVVLVTIGHRKRILSRP